MSEVAGGRAPKAPARLTLGAVCDEWFATKRFKTLRMHRLDMYSIQIVKRHALIDPSAFHMEVNEYLFFAADNPDGDLVKTFDLPEWWTDECKPYALTTDRTATKLPTGVDFLSSQQAPKMNGGAR